MGGAVTGATDRGQPLRFCGVLERYCEVSLPGAAVVRE
jgi:hypothetical protein